MQYKQYATNTRGKLTYTIDQNGLLENINIISGKIVTTIPFGKIKILDGNKLECNNILELISRYLYIPDNIDVMCDTTYHGIIDGMHTLARFTDIITFMRGSSLEYVSFTKLGMYVENDDNTVSVNAELLLETLSKIEKYISSVNESDVKRADRHNLLNNPKNKCRYMDDIISLPLSRDRMVSADTRCRVSFPDDMNNSELIAQRLPATVNETTPTAGIAISKLSFNIKGEIIIFRKYYNIKPTHIAGTYTSNLLLMIVTDGITFSFDSYRLDDVDNLDKKLGSVFNTIFNRTDEYKLQYKTFFDKGGINGILYVKIKNITYGFHTMGMYTIDKKDNTIIVDADTLRDFIQDLRDEVLLSI